MFNFFRKHFAKDASEHETYILVSDQSSDQIRLEATSAFMRDFRADMAGPHAFQFVYPGCGLGVAVGLPGGAYSRARLI